MLSVASAGYAVDHDAIVAGVVRDTKGVPQIGALVQVVSASNSAIRVTTFTDLDGRYLVRSLLPGKYGIRVSAALFLPTSRENLRLEPDHRSVVNVTLGGLLEPSLWLPARARGSDERNDDWNWTLRSSAGRPILKLDKDGTAVDAARIEGPAKVPAIRARATVRSASKRFGDGTTRVAVAGQTVRRSGTEITVESAMGQESGAAGRATPVSVSGLVERPLGFAGSVGSRVSYESHPEIVRAGGGAGLKVVSLSSAERFHVGDFAEVEAGSRVEAISGPASAVVSRPFLLVSAHPAAEWTLAYGLATSPDTQDYQSALGKSALGEAGQEGDLPIAAHVDGRVEKERSLHQEISVSHRTRATLLSIGYYKDTIDRVALAGVEGFGSAQAFGAEDAEFLVDQNNGSFRALSTGYRGGGVHILLTRAVGGHTWVALQYCTGTALASSGTTNSGVVASRLPVEARRSETATASVKANIARTGTRVRTSYRWQPEMLVTEIDPYDVLAGGAYLGFHVRQPVRLRRVLPDGVEFTADGTNVLGQGYRKAGGTGGTPLYLAASPTNVQAGVSFSF